MKLKPRHLLIAFLTFVAAAGAVVLWLIVYGPPVIRNHHYWELVGDFQRAQSKAEERDGDEKAWDFQVQIPGSSATARVRASSNMGIATIKYSDEGATRHLYEYSDYMEPVGIRIKENVLYAHWAHTLFNTKNWILAYDLVGRHEITRRRIDPNDLGAVPLSSR
ncbi:MAG: hypothetical protein J2P21_16870 [Chloracidobacterium sp.]|nr:hypothetical protein [Chloracidobacterium sp.]